MTRLVIRHATLAALALVIATPLAAQRTIPGLDAAAIDTTVRPGDDFYRYANGNWERNTRIPNDRSSFGAFNIAAVLADAHVRDIVHGAAASHAATGTELRKVGDFYTSFLDTAAIAARGTAPLQPVLDSVAAIGDKAALARFIGAHLRADVDPINLGTLHTSNLFGFWVTQDFNRPSRYSAALLQGGLEMPDRSYYLDSSAKMNDVRTAYRAHIGRMLNLANVSGADAKADSIVALETKIAAAH
jgi:putative endopeptidase